MTSTGGSESRKIPMRLPRADRPVGADRRGRGAGELAGRMRCAGAATDRGPRMASGQAGYGSGHIEGTGWPTDFFRIASASDAVTSPSPL